MSRLSTSFILGYHGCDDTIAKRLVSNKAELKPSENDFDWLGHGVYFWEADPNRAFDYATQKMKRDGFKKVAVVGAIIDLRNCLDLTNQMDLQITHDAYQIYRSRQAELNLQIVENADLTGDKNKDLLLRYLDCAVINFLHEITDSDTVNENYDTVRGMFTEGGPLYEGAGFQKKTHTQIAVRNPKCIKGYFWPRPD